MAIKLINRSMDIPIYERNIGHTGDNLVEKRTFEMNRYYGDVDLSEFDFKLDTEIGDVKNIIDLDKAVFDKKITLTWTVAASHVLNAGRMTIQLRAFKGEVEKWHSAQDYVIVQPSIAATEAQPSPLPSEFEEMEVRVTAMKNDAEEAAQTATEQANRAQGIADNFDTVTLPTAVQTVEDAGQAKVDLATAQAVIATTKAGEASDSSDAALASEQAAKASEDRAKISEDNAKDSEVAAGTSEGIASQALADLLAMMGSDIATLVNGKLTPSQIPSIAINDTFPVADTSEMLQLTAQRGDCAVIMDAGVVTDSYILAGDDPAILDNWTKLGISYVAEAGHAQTATDAENAAMINNHRVVVMTQEQYDQAVLDPDTVYLVSGV